MACIGSVTKEYLEDLTKLQIESFTIKDGVGVGENFASSIYVVDVTLKNSKSIIRLFAKCFPDHPARQKSFKDNNFFWNELCIYRQFLPALSEMCVNNNLNIKLPFPKLIAGKAVNFRNNCEEDDKLYDGFDLCLILEDIRSLGFRMGGRLGLDVVHMRLVIIEYAKLHALTWAYKSKHKLNTLLNQFPFFLFDIKENWNLFASILENGLHSAAEASELKFGKESPILESLPRLMDKTLFVLQTIFTKEGLELDLSKIHRKGLDFSIDKMVPWKVGLHGDSWKNNFLFSYDDKNKTPLEVMIVDLQMMREGCPTTDLSYLFYSCTTTELRKNHLDELLELYYLNFIDFCKKLNVPLLPNFTLQELKQRFHISKIFGFMMGSFLIPNMMKVSDAQKAENLEKHDNMENVIKKLMGRPSIECEDFTERITSLVQELYEEGVI